MILELAASTVRIFRHMGSRRFLIAVAVAAFLCAAEPAAADLLLYRCGNDVCRAAPDGSGKRKLTRAGTHTWLSASADGSRLAVVRNTFAYLLDGRGRQVAGPLTRGGTVVIAELSPDGSQVATIELLPEITPAPVGSPPGSPGIAGLQPYLFLSDGTSRDVVARATADTAWFGTRLTRTDPGDASPFPLGVCLLAVNTEFPCERDLARDPAQDVFNPAFSPDGSRVAVVQGPPRHTGAGPLLLYDTATAAPVRVLAGGPATQPSWSPDGKRIAFEQDGDLYVGRTSGNARRILRGGVQPVWTTAPACKARPRVRTRRNRVIVTVCAPQPGRVTITLRADGRRVARRTVRAATGGTVEVRLRRPADRSARLHVAATVR
jgi:Dipeptidyl peptidase IV (DPP IV) N-terminal region